MHPKLRLAKDVFNKYVNDDRQVRWPEDELESSLLARALLGKSLITRFDYEIDKQFAFIDNHEIKFEPKENSPLGIQYAQIRKNFSSFNTDQKEFIKKIILETKFQSIFDFLVRFDQPDRGNYDLRLNLSDSEEHSEITIKILDQNQNLDDLHNDLFDWLYSFSKFGKQLIELKEEKHSWSFVSRNLFEEHS